MRGLSLAGVVVTSLSVGIGLARADYLGQPFHAAPAAGMATHKISPAARHVSASSDPATWYIVRLKDASASLYRGDVAGYAATSAHVKGQRMLDAFAPETRAYVDYLGGRQADMLTRAQSALERSLTPRFKYRYALNGMSLKLTSIEALTLAHLDGVASVEPVRYYKPAVTIGVRNPPLSIGSPPTPADTNASRAWINAPGIWGASPGTEGEGIVVADVDTGINDANSSFFATGPLDSYAAVNPLGSGNYLGVCSGAPTTPKPSFFNCNDKLIGAYSYTHGTNDPNSPEDSEGHGSHTASTMVGDFTTTMVNGVSTPLSGVAPHASIIVYDVCDPTDLCASDGAVSAIEQAMQDQTTIEKAATINHVPFYGMVLNYSIGGGDASTGYSDSVEQAFLSAVEAGIYVSAAGGNGGPENIVQNDPINFPVYPVEHVVPWVASTAAATHSGIVGNQLENFSGGDNSTLPSVAITGVSSTAGFGPANIVYAGNYAGDDPVITGSTRFSSPASPDTYPPSQGQIANAQQCLYPFAPSTFTGSPIVVCDRGTNPLIDKAYNVEQGGAGGVVIAATSTSDQDLVVESYAIPGTLISKEDGNALRAWLKASFNGGSSGTAEAQLSSSVVTTDPSQADQVAGFSSRGPTNSAFDNLVKPELTAPGVSVLAAYSNPSYSPVLPGAVGSGADTYAFIDGTSMASPHDTASAALLMALHPGWTPAEIRSALMLTAVTTNNGTSPGLTDQCASLDSGLNCMAGTSLPSPQVRGAGRIDVEAANRTGLLLDENGADYLKADPDHGGDLTALNLPGLANNNCITTCSWTRTFTSAFTSASASYTISVSNLTPGLKLSVSPNSFKLTPGARQQITVNADSGGVKKGVWAFGEIDIATGDTGDNGAVIPVMHLPVSVQSVSPSAHMSIDQTGLSFDVAQGANGTQQFIISNDGQVTLNWKLSTVSNASTQSIGSQMAASMAAKPLSTGNIWDQTGDGTDGFPSDSFSPDGHGIYSADTFALPVKADISQIVAQGFAQSGSGPVPITGMVNWYIYADSSGQPAGDPEDGKKDYVWHYSADAASAGVDVSNGIVRLDLAAAGQPDAVINAGSYWLIVAPTFNSPVDIQNNPTWFWFVTTSETGKGMIIDPGNLLGQGKTWESLDKSLVFTLSGTLDCGGGAMAGLSLSATSGSVKAGSSETLTATYSGGNQAVGTHTGAVCVSGNASDNPQIVLPVTAGVTQGSGKGGGGGELDLVALVGLAWLVWRKRRV